MLDLKEFQNVVDDIIERYPQVEILFKEESNERHGYFAKQISGKPCNYCGH
jgi:hypothetical protein